MKKIISVLKTAKNYNETDIEHDIKEKVFVADTIIGPARKTFFKRFPIIALFVVTFGTSMTFFGIERMIIEIPWLDRHPLSIFIIGVLTLMLTGTLYKKLGGDGV